MSEGKTLSLDELLRTASLAGATDVLLSPAPHVGKLIVRAAASTLMSRVVEPGLLRSLSTQLGLRTGQPALLGVGSDTMEASIASFELEGRDARLRIRVICTPTPSGPMVRLRLQSRDVLREALERFQEGRFGGLEVLARLTEARGVIVVSGPTSSGKTSALHHLAASLPDRRAVCIISEAQEFVAVDCPAASPDEADVVLLDEMDEAEKLALAMHHGAHRLVLATLTAPTLATALRRIRGASDSVDLLVGLLRVDWRKGGAMRVPDYHWFGVEGHGNPTRIPRALLDHMDDLEAYNDLERLEAP